MKKTALFFVSCFAAVSLQAQIKFGDNAIVILPGSVLELESTNKALVLPRMNTVQQNSIPSPVAGMIIYNNDSNCVSQYSAGSWRSLCSSRSSSLFSVFADTTAANAAAPTQKFDGNVIYDLSCGCTKVYYSGGWRTTGDFALARVFADTSAANSATPTTRINGNIIVDQSTTGLRIFTNNKWVTPSASPLNYVFNDTTDANAFVPSLKVEGQQIFDKSSNSLKVFIGGKWVNADGTPAGPTSFSARIAASNPLLTINLGTATTEINFVSTDYNIGNAYATSATDSRFIAPVTGTYHFDIAIAASVSVSALGNRTVSLFVDNTQVYSTALSDNGLAGLAGLTTQDVVNFSKDLRLNAGQEVRIYLGTTGVSLGVNLITANTYFDGHLVR